MTEALCERFISRPSFLHCRDTNSERDHHRTPSECTTRSHPGTVQELCKNSVKHQNGENHNLSRICNIDGKVWPSKWSSSESKNSTTSNGESFQDPKHQKEHPYSKSNRIQSNSSSFQDQNPWRVEEKQQNKLISRPSIRSMTKRVQELNLKYYLLTNEQTKSMQVQPIYVESGGIQLIVPGTCKPCFPTLLIK